jgi:hypothetical protein
MTKTMLALAAAMLAISAISTIPAKAANDGFWSADANTYVEKRRKPRVKGGSGCDDPRDLDTPGCWGLGAVVCCFSSPTPAPAGHQASQLCQSPQYCPHLHSLPPSLIQIMPPCAFRWSRPWQQGFPAGG